LCIERARMKAAAISKFLFIGGVNFIQDYVHTFSNFAI
jgi:hypothetical protein